MAAPLAGLADQPVGLGVFAAIGVLGGAHCLGMCGPLVATYADRMGGPDDRLRWRDVRQHGLFNLGRTVSYAAMGALLGGLGGLVFDAAAIVALADVVRGTAGVLVGAFVLVVGLSYLRSGGAGGGVNHLHALPGAAALFERLSGAMLARVESAVDGPRIVALGAVHAVLPCPLLFPVYLYAFARGSPVEGAVALGVLGLGTFPTLFLFGTVVGSVGARWRSRLHRALGACFLLLGLVALTHGLRLFGLPVPRIPLPVYQPLG